MSFAIRPYFFPKRTYLFLRWCFIYFDLWFTNCFELFLLLSLQKRDRFSYHLNLAAFAWIVCFIFSKTIRISFNLVFSPQFLWFGNLYIVVISNILESFQVRTKSVYLFWNAFLPGKFLRNISFGCFNFYIT